MKRKLLISCLVATAAFASGSAQAALTAYAGAIGGAEDNAWSSAVNFTGSAEDTFNDSVNLVDYPLGYIIQGAGFTSATTGINYASNNALFITNQTYGGGIYNLAGMNDGLLEYGSAADNGVLITPAVSYTAFGIDLRGVDGAGTFNISFNSGAGGVISNQTFTADPTGSFFGVTSTAAISNLVITPTSGHMAFDNIIFATANVVSNPSVPEPSSIALLGLGLAALGWKSRRRVTAV